MSLQQHKQRSALVIVLLPKAAEEFKGCPRTEKLTLFKIKTLIAFLVVFKSVPANLSC